MRRNIYLLISGIGLLGSLQMLPACAEKNETTQAVIKENTGGSSVFGDNTEQKLDRFLTDYVQDLKEALAETDDKKAAAKIQQMQEEYSFRAEELKAEVEAWESSLSEDEKKAFEQRAENKPYIQDLLTTSFTAMGRMSKSPELRKAFEELNAQVDFGDKEVNMEEPTGEEYPEDVVEETDK